MAKKCTNLIAIIHSVSSATQLFLSLQIKQCQFVDYFQFKSMFITFTSAKTYLQQCRISKFSGEDSRIPRGEKEEGRGKKGRKGRGGEVKVMKGREMEELRHGLNTGLSRTGLGKLQVGIAINNRTQIMLHINFSAVFFCLLSLFILKAACFQ